MRYRVSILDLTAAIVVLVVIFLPQRSFNISPAYSYTDEQIADIARYQGRLAANPGDAMAAEKLADLLIEVNEEDWAVQVAADAAKRSTSQAWRALLAVSAAHANRFEVSEAYRFAKSALEACMNVGPEQCPVHQRVRMKVYRDQLEAGVESGIDPRVDPSGYQRAVLNKIRVIRVRGATPRMPDTPDKSGGGSGESQSSDTGDSQGGGSGAAPAPGSSP